MELNLKENLFLTLGFATCRGKISAMADVEGWHLVGQDGDTSASEGALSRPVSPSVVPAGPTPSHSCGSLTEQQQQQQHLPNAHLPSACGSSSSNGGASPAVRVRGHRLPFEQQQPGFLTRPDRFPCQRTIISGLTADSERLADSVLGQPFPLPPAGVDLTQLGDRRSVLPALTPFHDQAGKRGPYTSLAVHAAMDPGEQSEELETVMSLQALSGEGSLEGFHDSAALTTQMAYVEAQGNTADLPESNPASTLSPAYQPQGWLSWLEQGLGALSSLLAYIPSKVASVWRACATELHEEVMDLRHVLAHTKQYFSQEVTKGSGKVAYAMTGRTPRASTLVPLLSLSTIVACCGLLHFMARCQRLNGTVQQRERELSRLILKVLNLQEALQQPRRVIPVLRHTGIVPGVFSVSSCML